METLGSNPRCTHVIPNGLRRDFYEQARESFEARKRGYPGKNVLGYFGHLTDKWFNWPLLVKTAKKMPQTRFEIIGFGAPETLSLPTNVTLMGEMSHAEILEIASRWRAALIPFKQSQLARAVDPIKLYEYLALGLPVVACWMDNLLSSPRTFIYKRDKDFMKTITAAVKQPPTEVNWEALDTFLKNSFWQMRVEDTLSLVLDTAHLGLGH
jgi:glycosyltransferase involved in cell wall biosynthesis